MLFPFESPHRVENFVLFNRAFEPIKENAFK